MTERQQKNPWSCFDFEISFLKTIRQTFLPPVKCRTTIFERTLWTWGRKTSCSLKLRKTPNKRRCSSNLNGKEATLSTKLRNRYYFSKICSTKRSPLQSKSFIEDFLAYVVLFIKQSIVLFSGLARKKSKTQKLKSLHSGSMD